MVERFEGRFPGHDKAELFYQTWRPRSPRGVVLITHGLAEHGECYGGLALELAGAGWFVHAWDLRGHGRSSGKRGFARGLGDFTADLACFYGLVRDSNPGLPIVPLGHSLGGLVTLVFAEAKRPDVAALALSAPALGLSMRVSKFKRTLAEVAGRWAPALTLANDIDYGDLTRDPDRAEAMRRDPLRHDKISPGVFLGMLEGFPRALEGASSLACPVLLQIGGADRIVDVAAAKALFGRLPGKQNLMIEYPGGAHELFNDLDRAVAVADLCRFIAPFGRGAAA